MVAFRFNPSFCGFGIGGFQGRLRLAHVCVSILVSVDSVLEVSSSSSSMSSSPGFNPSFCGFGIGGSCLVMMTEKYNSFNPSFCGFGIGG